MHAALTATRRVSLVVTELAVIEPTELGLVLRETAPGLSVDAVKAATEARLTISDTLCDMPIGSP